MARARLLKPSFFTNDRLSALPTHARLLFQGLWCVADREGRVEDRPARLKVEILPYDKVNVDRLLSLLDDAGFIQRYESDGRRLIQVLAFAKHQSPHVREPESILPAPCEPSAELVLGTDEHGTGPAVPIAVTETVTVPSQLLSFDEELRGLRGYRPTASFYDKVIERYFSLDLHEEAIKMRGWVEEQPEKNATCTTARVLGWLKRAYESTPAPSKNGARSDLNPHGQKFEVVK